MYRVLLITYYWPPAGGGGVQRWLKFVKYLREFDIEPIIYTPSNPDYPAIDESLRSEIPNGIEEWRHPIWEPYHLYRKFTGKPADEKIYSGFITGEKKESFSQKISVFIRGNFFIPDARKFWIKPSIQYLTERLAHEKIDAIISTGPPHSMHLIAEGVAGRTSIPWIADFRDPWTGIDFYDKLRLTSWANWQHHRKERRVLHNASEVVTVSPYCVEHLESLCQRKVHLITNGYDDADFTGHQELSSAFTITHIGSINKDRNPVALWESLETLLHELPGLNDHLEVKIIGPADGSVLDTINKQSKLSSLVSISNWMDHHDAILEMRRSQVLLLLINDTIHTRGLLPGKLFEYFGSNRPILCIGSTDGDAARLITGSHSGRIADFADSQAILKILRDYYNAYLSGDLKNSVTRNSISRFSRRNLAGEYARLIKSLLR